MDPQQIYTLLGPNRIPQVTIRGKKSARINIPPLCSIARLLLLVDIDVFFLIISHPHLQREQ
ncbi:hypothetical protein RchiOBHm_Chr7g0216831 [Rosa chinensis]|uniref:Uncharacterized protein n=1 Tax=Rosa chinensis TaxID=74649 RepID=A0A2P6PBU6_ROSCH|nr:hypothetical protein RchiOBHm_Chr7g0216831 [Rosa chinensis]